MSEKKLTTRIQQKTDTKANWDKATNFVPLKGEYIYYSDLHKVKVGDGVTKVGSLPFLADSDTHQSIKTLNTNNTAAQATSASESIAGSGTINLHKVAKTGNYNDLNNRPVLATVATTGSYNSLNDKPALAAVAISGDYNSLSNKPDLDAKADNHRHFKSGDSQRNAGVYTYYKLASFPIDNAENSCSLTVDGRIGGWNNGNKGYLSMVISNRDGVAASGTLIGNADLSLCDLVVYTSGTASANSTAILYVKTYSWFAFDLTLGPMSGATDIWDGQGTNTTPEGTLAWSLSENANKFLQIRDNGDINAGANLAVSGNLTVGNKTVLTDHQSIKTLKTDNTAAQAVSANEAIAGSGTINLHKVAKTGSYNDLNNKPALAAVATTGSYNSLNDKPILAKVATTNSYNDLDNKPALLVSSDVTNIIANGFNLNSQSNISWNDSGHWYNNNQGVTYPYDYGGLHWRGQSDGIDLFARERDSDQLDLIFKLTDDNSNAIRVLDAYDNNTLTIAADGSISSSGNISVGGTVTVGEKTVLTDHQSIKTLRTDNTAAQATSASESIAGSGTINLHKVSKTGSYNDLNDKPTIPTVNNGTLTIQQNGSNVASFTANSSSNVIANITVPTVNNGRLTIQQNGKNVANFYANASMNATANITVPTKLSELENDSGYVASVTHVGSGDTINALKIDPSTKVLTAIRNGWSMIAVHEYHGSYSADNSRDHMIYSSSATANGHGHGCLVMAHGHITYQAGYINITDTSTFYTDFDSYAIQAGQEGYWSKSWVTATAYFEDGKTMYVHAKGVEGIYIICIYF